MLQMLCTFSHVNTSSWISPISEHKECLNVFPSSYFPTHRIKFSCQLCEANRRAVSVEGMRVLNYGKCHYGNCIDQLYFFWKEVSFAGKKCCKKHILAFPSINIQRECELPHDSSDSDPCNGKEIIQLISIISDANLQLGEMMALFFFWFGVREHYT